MERCEPGAERIERRTTERREILGSWKRRRIAVANLQDDIGASSELPAQGGDRSRMIDDREVLKRQDGQRVKRNSGKIERLKALEDEAKGQSAPPDGRIRTVYVDSANCPVNGRTACGSAKMAGTPPVCRKTSELPRGYLPARTSAMSAARAFAV
jgi:hypothetical protein